ncbi:DEAD/DEAH box helicase [Rhodoblastus acidophilus]|uniref:DEAD/DEAH box helicase n=1 Tax=Candidatus Rhodoblastus alkanivorans TaxID=2954117 RepID=A0ABS9Z4K0_9HYPH|nr:DEAD/DEAH box helicase [Candidatus Rhodoblastus alkanivorans]MCI4677705.1 DEAD/DEAH box helicase [Candidatus Rhodoblastus alkanivorans]MCI4682563.1 DEAD/DEAH box helicase [Candidatus Rhodoblastus alkanivorans]MDI4639869.1 DEAD/DEAH box helicase [Rhodoblastus acidophilus]
MTTFSDLGLAETILRALKSEGYETPTPIQAQAIPPLLEGRDLLGIAQTGTGKTCAFATPLITRLLQFPENPRSRQTRVLVLAPTRELAAQIGDSFKTYGRFAGLRVATIFGGVGFGPQVQALSRGLDVLVATPGRLLDHMAQGNLRLDGTSAVVLDEADHMLDLGFVVPIRKIFAKLPKRRQTLFFSATMPPEIATLAAEMLHQPVTVSVTPVAKTADRVAQRVILIEAKRKREALVDLLQNPDFRRSIVFTRTKRGADRVASALVEAGHAAEAIHGNKSQNQRSRALDGFRSGRVAVLVATDIAARGIDVDGVSHVVNFELPEVPEAYVHRIGRTARAGAEGEAISFCDHEERDLLRGIEKLTKQTIPTTDLRLAPNAAGETLPAEKKPDARFGRPNGVPAVKRSAPRRDGERRRAPRPSGEGRPRQGEAQAKRR